MHKNLNLTLYTLVGVIRICYPWLFPELKILISMCESFEGIQDKLFNRIILTSST